MSPWQGFNGGNWQYVIDVRDFIQKNYRPYTGCSGFLTGPSSKTSALWEKVLGLLQEERARGGILDAESVL